MNADNQLKAKADKRQQFIHKGQLVYEWDQTIDDVNIYIRPPPFLLPKNRSAYQAQLPQGQQLPKLEVKITASRLQVGMTGNPPYLDVCHILNVGRIRRRDIGQRFAVDARRRRVPSHTAESV